MEVILQEDISTLGKAGEIVKVRDGYARNYLFPQKKAVLADRSNVKQLEHHKKAIASRQAKVVKAANDLKAKMEGFAVSIVKDSGEEGKLFGSVTSLEIVEQLKQNGFTVDKKMIHLQEPIRALGDFEVPVKIYSDIVANIKLSVVKK